MSQKSVIIRAIDQGRGEGRLEYRKKVLTWLEDRYLKNDVERGSDLGVAILSVTKELSEYLKED